MGRSVGIALNDDFADICVGDSSRLRSIPTVVCKKKHSDIWLVGEQAYKENLMGGGVIVDKLLMQLRKNGTATIEKKRYTARAILGFFIIQILSEELGNIQEDDEFIISLRKPDRLIMLRVREVMISIGISEKRVHIFSHTEAFVHYILQQDKNLYNRMVGMFELSNQCLYYYEMAVSVGPRKYVLAASEPQEEEAFSLDVLKAESGSKIADKILRSVAEKNMMKKSYSSVFLAGRGFTSTDFAPEFMSFICSRRRVCIEPGIFAIGAMLYGDVISGRRSEEYTVICDTRVSCEVSVRVTRDEKEQNLPLISAGSAWLDHKAEKEMILDRQNYIDFRLTPLSGRRPLQLRMLLEGLPERENRTTKIRLSTEFLGPEKMKVTVTDEGFGELFPKSDFSVSEEINLADAAL